MKAAFNIVNGRMVATVVRHRRFVLPNRAAMKVMAVISEKLAEELEKRESSEVLEVILELRPRASSTKEASSRTEKIAALKEAFNRAVAPLEEVLRKLGGEVTQRAWINYTLRARVPAERLKELAEHEEIAVVDVPHRLTPDSTS